MREELLKKASDNNVTNQELPDLYTHLAWTLDFHQREAKPKWWNYFDRLSSSIDELLEDVDCLANLERTSLKPFKFKSGDRSLCYEYQFPVEQEWQSKCKDFRIIGELGKNGKEISVEAIESASQFDNGVIVLKCNQEPPNLIHIIPFEIIPIDIIVDAITKIAANFLANDITQNAIFDFLKRHSPRINHLSYGSPIITTNDREARLDQVIKAIKNLNGSYFTIQGPPGTGKTFTAKKVIAELLRQNKRIGISSNSHNAINNLLFSVAEYCSKQNIPASFFCTKDTNSQVVENFEIVVCKNVDLTKKLPQSACVVGTTVWGFAREDLTEQFDYLFRL